MKLSLRTKLSGWFLLAGLLPLVVVGYLSHHCAVSILEEKIESNLEAYVRLEADHIRSYFEGRRQGIDMLARTPFLIEAVPALVEDFQTGGTTSTGNTALQARVRSLLAYRREVRNYHDLLVISPAGDVVNSIQKEADLGTNLKTGPYRNSELARAYREALSSREAVVSRFRPYGPSGGRLAAFVAAPIFHGDSVIGVMVGQVNAESVADLVDNTAGLGPSAETIVATRIGERAVFLNPAQGGRGPTVQDHSVVLGSKHGIPIQRAVEGTQGMGVFKDHGGKEVLVAWRYMPELDLGLKTKQRTDEALAPVHALTRRTIGIGLVTLLVLICVSVLVSRRVSRPIQALTRAAERMARGDLSIRTEQHGHDEIGALGTAFNQMTDQLDRRNRLTMAINQVFREALTCRTEEEVARISLRKAEELTGSKFGWIGEINEAGLLDTIAISNPGWEACNVVVSDAKHFIKNMPLRGIDRSALIDGKSRIVQGDQIATHPDRVGTPEGHPEITCFLGVPFKHEDRTVGMIALANKEGGYTLQDQETIEALSGAFFEALFRKRAELEVQAHSELKTGQNELSDRMRGADTTEELCQRIITYLCHRLDAQTGVLYVAGEDGTLRFAAGHAHRTDDHRAQAFKPGEGLVGQVALERRRMVLTEVPEDYFTIESGLGETLPRTVCIHPVVHGEQVRAVVELGTLDSFAEAQERLLDAVTESVAMALESAASRHRLASSLEEAQRLSEELEAQQEELRVSNEELEEKNELLERQKREVEQTRRKVQEKAEELALASRYKSEFLANMSHELRTPLNSLLLLAQGLARNKDGNLSEEQVESVRIIHGSGRDLLELINEILDLARIEAGRLELQVGPVRTGDLADSVRASFAHVAEDQGLALDVMVSGDAPEVITSDRKRIEQVLRNFISNAIKFTEKGRVTVIFRGPDGALGAAASGHGLSIEVRDTGIGIAPEEQPRIFEAFQQGEGGTRRRYGGTGLGLSISRELAHLLGGEIRLASEPGQGSTFTLILPPAVSGKSRVAPAGVGSVPAPRVTKSPAPRAAQSPASASRPRLSTTDWIQDDRHDLQEDDRTILVIEDDRTFARVLRDHCRERGFKCVGVPTGEDGVALARELQPCAVLLDLRLPGMNGWEVLAALKDDSRLRHIPVHVVSVEDAADQARRLGAIGFLAKPVDRDRLDQAFHDIEALAEGRVRRLLVVEDDETARRSIVDLVQNGEVEVDEAEGGKEALEALRARRYDCVILDLGLEDMDGQDLLVQMARDVDPVPPVIVYTARDLTREEQERLMEHASTIILKDVRSRERLLDEVSLFLHQVVDELPESKQRMITELHDPERSFLGRKILLVDDDMRTVFALSRFLAEHGVSPLKAENGKKALAILENEPDVDVVLLDIMMPEMDGYETLERIRAQDRFRELPVIVLTAKAMKEDRDRCMAAGASDYLPKPVEENRLLSLLRVWLHRGGGAARSARGRTEGRS